MSQEAIPFDKQRQINSIIETMLEKRFSFRQLPGQRGYHSGFPFWVRHIMGPPGHYLNHGVRRYTIDLIEFNWEEISQGTRRDLVCSWQPRVRLYLPNNILLDISLTGYTLNTGFYADVFEHELQRVHAYIEELYVKLGCVPTETKE